jgi:RNA polymerase sigma factor (TIGR02999 family)
MPGQAVVSGPFVQTKKFSHAIRVLSLQKCIVSVSLLYCSAMGKSPPLPPRIEPDELQAAEQFLPHVYGELRKLAAALLAREKPGQTLEPTGLVHEAYLRLAAGKRSPLWHNRQHFIAAAAKTMRRILVELARQKSSLKNGGNSRRVDIDLDQFSRGDRSGELLAVNDALSALAAQEPVAAQLVELHYFAGMTLEEASAALEISVRTAYRYWAYARAWLHQKLEAKSEASR